MEPKGRGKIESLRELRRIDFLGTSVNELRRSSGIHCPGYPAPKGDDPLRVVATMKGGQFIACKSVEVFGR
jgi:hypothetical protein